MNFAMLRVASILLMLLSCFASTIATGIDALSGKQLAFSRSKGNCLACHAIADGDMPGNIGPPLQDLSSRFTNKKQLYGQIWDATKFNPETSMPPFGKNKILSDDEINRLVDYLWTL